MDLLAFLTDPLLPIYGFQSCSFFSQNKKTYCCFTEIKTDGFYIVTYGAPCLPKAAHVSLRQPLIE